MSQAVVVFSFPEPEDPIKFGSIVAKAKKSFLEMDNEKEINIDEVKIYAAINKVADEVLFIFAPLHEEDSNLVKHARRELELAGNDEDFNMSIINAVRAFTSYGHSGGSASVAIPMLNELLQFKNLTPLTDDPKEWMKISEDDGWQSRRNAEAFSMDEGKTYYLLSDGSNNTKQEHIYISAKHIKENNGSRG